MSLKWIKGDIKPPKDGSYYLIRKRKSYITIDVDYYYHSYNNWERFGKMRAGKFFAGRSLLTRTFPKN